LALSSKPEAMKIFTIAVIPSVCEESNLKSRDKLLALQPFKLDSSHPLRMTAMMSFKFNLMALGGGVI